MVALFYQWLMMLLLMPAFSTSPEHMLPKPLHPFYASVTEINHNAKDKTLEISCKVFADDFEKILEGMHHTPLDIYHPASKEELQGFMRDYLEKHLQIRLDGKPVQLSFLGYETEEQSAWCYLQVTAVEAPHRVDIDNDIFYETYHSQINIMHVVVGGKRQSTKLDYPDTKASFNF